MFSVTRPQTPLLDNPMHCSAMIYGVEPGEKQMLGSKQSFANLLLTCLYHNIIISKENNSNLTEFSYT